MPGALPCTSTWLVEVTNASAMSGVDSATRVIGRSTLNTVDRPTSSSIIRVELTALAAAARRGTSAPSNVWAPGGATMIMIRAATTLTMSHGATGRRSGCVC